MAVKQVNKENKERIAGWHENDNVIAAHQGDAKRSTVGEHVYHKESGCLTTMSTAHIPKVIINTNTKAGTETAQEGDSINYSQPNSKTRRGRVGVGVGVGVAQTIDTQVNQAVVVSHYGHKDKDPVISDNVPTLKAQSHGHEPMVMARPVLTPDRLEKRQNGRRFKDDGDDAFTLTGQDKHGVQINQSIRRLTEVECERLQSFPDNWTEFGDYDGVIKKISKTQRYKMCGNAVSVCIPRHIVLRMKDWLVDDPE